MTTKHRRGLMAPKRLRFAATPGDYGKTRLDLSWDELSPDPCRGVIGWSRYLGSQTSKSEAIQALLVLIEWSMGHTYYDGYTPDVDYGIDLAGFCKDAKLTDRQAEVVLMVGDGWGIRAISRQLGLSHPTVIQHLRTGRAKLIRQIPPMDTYQVLEWMHVEHALMGVGA